MDRKKIALVLLVLATFFVVVFLLLKKQSSLRDDELVTKRGIQNNSEKNKIPKEFERRFIGKIKSEAFLR